MAQEDITLRVGDISRVITFHVKHPADDPTNPNGDFNLTGYTMSLLFPDGTSPHGTVALLTATSGTFTLTTDSTDSTAVVAPQKYRIRAVKSTTNQYTWDGGLWSVVS